MSDITIPANGWQPPTDKKRAENERYLLGSVLQAPVLGLEKTFDYPQNLVSWYDQGNLGACTGYSASWMMTIYNQPHKYNGTWLYRAGRKEAGLPPNQDTGGYMWAVMNVLRKQGHCLDKTTTPIKAEGIQSYYWIKTVDDIRAAYAANRVPVLGTYWYSEFMEPRTINGERWIGTRSNWGVVVGGHMYCTFAISDEREAVRVVNSWGSAYPPVWLGYRSIERLLKSQGECSAALDIDPVTPEPPEPEPTDNTAHLTIGGVKYSGVVERV